MSAAATVLYLWATVQDLAGAIISGIVIIAAGIALWRMSGIPKE